MRNFEAKLLEKHSTLKIILKTKRIAIKLKQFSLQTTRKQNSKMVC